MQPTKYLEALHDAGDGTLFIVFDVSAGREYRARRTGDLIRIEKWERTDCTELSIESVAALHVLAERRISMAKR